MFVCLSFRDIAMSNRERNRAIVFKKYRYSIDYLWQD